jgi:hypothetical protein
MMRPDAVKDEPIAAAPDNRWLSGLFTAIVCRFGAAIVTGTLSIFAKVTATLCPRTGVVGRTIYLLFSIARELRIASPSFTNSILPSAL